MAAPTSTSARPLGLCALLASSALGPRAAAQGRDEATVRATARRELTRVTLEPDELRRAPGSFGDPLRALQNLPGLARPPLFSGSLIVRGATPADTAVLVDGTFLPAAYHFGGLGSTLSPEMIERIDFSPGNFSARYGRATGGVVDVTLRDPTAEGARAVLHLAALDVGAFVESALSPRVSAAVAARFGWVGFLLSPVVSALTPYDLSLGYWDYQGVVTWRPTARDRVRISVYGCGDSAALGDGGGSVGGGLGFHLAQVRWTRALSADASLSVALSAGWNGLTVKGRAFGTSSLPVAAAHFNVDGALDAWPVHLRAELTGRASPRVAWRVGLDAFFGARTLTGALQSGLNGASFTQRETITQVQPAAYAELDLALSPRVHLRPGLRAEASLYTASASLSPRVTLDARAWPGGLLKLGVGTFTQPALDERASLSGEQLLLVTEILASRRTYGAGPAPRPERALHLGAGVEQQLFDRLSLNVEVFYKVIDDALVGYPSVDRVFSGSTDDMVSPVRYTGQGRAYGAELLARYRDPRRLQAWLAYTVMRAERRERPENPWWLYEYDQTHILTAMATVTIGAGWALGARFRYVSGRPSFAFAAVFDSLAGAPGGAVLTGQERNPDTHQLDLRVEKTWTRPWGTLSLHLEVVNVYNRRNADFFRADPDRTLTVPAGPYLPIVPNLGVRGVF